MVTQTQQFVNVEWIGGPFDGDVQVFPYPPPPSWRFAIPQWSGMVMTCDEYEHLIPVTQLIHEYRPSSRPHDYEIVTITDEIVRLGQHTINAAMWRKQPMQYEWQG